MYRHDTQIPRTHLRGGPWPARAGAPTGRRRAPYAGGRRGGKGPPRSSPCLFPGVWVCVFCQAPHRSNRFRSIQGFRTSTEVDDAAGRLGFQPLLCGYGLLFGYWEDSCRYPRVAAAAAARINQSTHPHSIPMHSNTTRSMPRRTIDPQIHLRLLDGRATAGTPSRPRKTRPADTRPPPRRSAYPEPPSFFPRPSKAADRSPRSSAPVSGQGGGGGS